MSPARKSKKATSKKAKARAAPRKAAKAAKKAKPKAAKAAAKPSAKPAKTHCAAIDPFGDPCQSIPRYGSKHCTIHSYLDH